jgi:hypothetical protein
VEPEDLSRFTGEYRGADGGTCSVFHAGTMLLARGNWEGWAELDPIGEDVFMVVGKSPVERVGFPGGPGASPIRLRWLREGKVVRDYTRLDSPAPAPSMDAGEFAGNYCNGELETTLELSPHGNGLLVRGPGQAVEPWAALPIEKDVFQGGRARCSFTRDSSGKISGFELQYNLTRLLWTKAAPPA